MSALFGNANEGTAQEFIQKVVEGACLFLGVIVGGELLRSQFNFSPTKIYNITYPANLNWSHHPSHITAPAEPLSFTDLLDLTTVVSLFAVLLILGASYALSQRVLSNSTPRNLRVLFIWHLFDFLIHTIFEGSFLYNCFNTSHPFNSELHHPGLITNFLQRPDLLYGAAYGDNWANKLWMVYAQADSRWAGADLTVVSLELLTVLGAGPLALWICFGIKNNDWRVNYWMIVLATAELYGGFMTFAPEWLTGSQNLDTSNFMYLWVYLFFFNTLWVWFPLYAMWVGYVNLRDRLGGEGITAYSKKLELDLKKTQTLNKAAEEKRIEEVWKRIDEAIDELSGKDSAEMKASLRKKLQLEKPKA